LACLKNHSLSVIQLLIDHYPEAINGIISLSSIECITRRMIRNTNNNIENRGMYGNIDIIELLIKEYPLALQTKDDNGILPLHVVCRSNQLEEIIKLLINKYPLVLEVPFNDGSSNLLHWAFRSYLVKESLINLFINTCPTIVQEQDNIGHYPVQLACR
jgi:ankyrin repeat protein